jgi:hypothetical protein
MEEEEDEKAEEAPTVPKMSFKDEYVHRSKVGYSPPFLYKLLTVDVSSYHFD